MKTRPAAFLVAATALVASCASSDSTDSTPPLAESSEPASAPPVATVSAPFDLGGLMRQVHFAYRPAADGWSGGHGSYEVLASARGFAVRPAAPWIEQAAPARFETVSIGRGERVTAAPPAVGRVEHDGHLALMRGAIVEHLRNGEEGVEQSFSFADKPRGAGDLLVRVRVTGHEYAGETASGHHFVDTASGLGLRYGEASWVDARGERTALEVVWRGGNLVLRVPEAVVERAAYPAVLDPTIGAEFGVDDPVYGPPTGNQTRPSVATNGTDYLVAWEDTRPGGPQVFAARVSGAGAVLDISGLSMGDIGATGDQLAPAVAWGGSSYLVVWAAKTTTGGGVVRGARVSSQGSVLNGGSGLQLATNVNPVAAPALAFDGTNYLVAWHAYLDASLANEVRATRVTPSGSVLSGASGFVVSSGTGHRQLPAMAFDGTNFLVAWQDRRSGTSYDVYAARVSKSGTVLDPAGLVVSAAAGDQGPPAVAFDGTNHLVAWSDGTTTSSDILATRVSPAGAVLDGTSLVIANATGAQTAPAVAFDGTSFVVAWGDKRSGLGDVYAARIDAAGVVQNPGGVPMSAGAWLRDAPSLACEAGSCLVAWQDSRSGTTDVYGARFAGGSVLDPAGIPIPHASNYQAAPAIGFDGANYLVVWHDYRLGATTGLTADIFGARVTPAGTPLDPAGIAISTATSAQLRPALAWMAPSYLVVWEDQREGAGTSRIYGARVGADGQVLDPTGIAMSTATATQRVPAVAADGTNYLVAWADRRGGVDRTYGARVSAAGAVLDPTGIAIHPLGTSVVESTAIAYDGARYLVVGDAAPDVRANRVLPDGTVLDGTGLVLKSGDRPAAGFDGANFVVVGSKNGGVLRTRVTGSGTLLDDGKLISTGTTGLSSDQPGIGCDGSGCLVIWRDHQTITHSDIAGTFLDQAGTILQPAGLAISTTAYDSSVPVAASAGAGRWLAVYEQAALASPFGSHRVRARRIITVTTGQPCSNAADCPTGFCVDGVCCDTACGGGATDDCSACSVAAGAPTNGVCAPLTGTACDDGNACTTIDTCQAGACVGGSSVVCQPLDDCHDAGACAPATGLCDNPAKPDGSACDDADACTQADACQGGVCIGGSPVACPAPDQCNDVAACDPATGACAVTPKADATPCSDGDACTQGDTCQAGVCTAGPALECIAIDACHVAGSCDPTTGQCSNPAQPDGTACDDGDACTMADACIAGTCVGASPKSCPAADECHLEGTCQPVDGACSSAPAPAGTPCSLGACDGTGVCVAPDAPPKDGGDGGPEKADPGCGCRLAPAESPAGSLAGVGIALAALAWQRRRRGSSYSRPGGQVAHDSTETTSRHPGRLRASPRPRP